MARSLRLEYPGALWHITSRGNNGDPLFFDDEDREHFLDLVGGACRRYGWIITAYVLMTNHFHLLVQTPEPTLSRGMQWLLGKYVSWFNKRHDRRGHLVGERFKGFLVEKETYSLNVLRYVVLNPVRARMVVHPGDYRWSSYRATAGLTDGPAWLATSEVLLQFAPDRVVAEAYYRDFVFERLEDESSIWKGLIDRLYLGSEAWMKQIRQRTESKPRSDEYPQAERHAGRPKMAAIIPVVAQVLDADEEGIRHGHGGIERQVVAWLGCFEGMLPRRAIAAGLRLSSQGSASGLIRSCEEALARLPTLRDVIDRCCDLLRGSPPAGTRPIGSTGRTALPA